MPKRTAQSGKGASPMLFADASKRRHRKLFLPKYLHEESFKAVRDDDSDFQKAKVMLGQSSD